MKFREIRNATENVLTLPNQLNNVLSAMFVAILILTAAVVTLVVTR